MKHLLLPLLLTLPATTWADDFYTAFPVTAATVFGQGALVSAQGTVTVPQGQHQVYLALPQSMLLNTTPRFAVAGATPVSVAFLRDLPTQAKAFFTPAQTEAQADVDRLDQALAELRASQAALQGEQAGLQVQFTYLQSIKPGGTDAAQSLEDLQAIAGFLPGALSDNRAAQGALSLQLKAAQKETADLTNQLTLAQTKLANLGVPQSDWAVAKLTVNADADTDVTVLSESFVAEANWQIRYDARLDEDAGKITLDRRALVSQFTGAAWVDAAITLSSAEPYQRLQPTIPDRDVVHLLEPPKATVRTLSKGVSAEADMMMAAPAQRMAGAEFAAVAGDFNGIEVTYAIPTPTTIGGGNSGAEQINLAPITLDADVDRYASPRRDETAFVRAMATNTTGEPILPGTTIFYRGDTLIGNGSMPAMAVNGKETMYFGPDDTLPLEMRFLSELKGDTGVFTKSNTRSEELAFIVENIGSNRRTVTVGYALPITVDEDVEVDVTAQPRPDVQDVKGVKGSSEWVLTLAPGARETVQIGVDITWPEGQDIRWRP